MTWDESTRWKYTTAWAQDSIGAGIDSVFKSATFEVAGAQPRTWSYYYDAFGRRRAKLSPESATDEHFYDLGHQMLSDRGNNLSTSERPEDDYVWLDGRPVVMVRGKFNSSMVRQADGPSSFCSRDEEAGLCGTFVLVTDYIGKPVLTLDRGNTSGTASYEAFGFANRREHRWGSAHGTSAPGSTTITPPMPSGFDGPLRVLTSRSKYGASSSVTLAGNSENSVLSGDRAHTWTNWRYASGNSWTLLWTGVAADYGVDVEAYEVQAKQTWTWWAWTPLRFLGHYYDKETELNENWNRYFDPRTNRYLSSEPMLQKLWFAQTEVAHGFAIPTYGYARSNPLRYTDENGLFAGGFSVGGGFTPAGTAAYGLGGRNEPPWMNALRYPNPRPEMPPVEFPHPWPEPEPEPSPGGGGSCGNNKERACEKLYRAGVRACQDGLMGQDPTARRADMYAICQVCLASALNQCILGRPDPDAEAQCAALLAGRGLRRPF